MNFLTHLYLSLMQHPYDTMWGFIGFLGQAIFGVRFVIQWLKSEQEGRSIVPIAFWYCSLAGGLISFAYAIHVQAWPLVMGQALPLPIYLRNIWMVWRDQRRTAS